MNDKKPLPYVKWIHEDSYNIVISENMDLKMRFSHSKTLSVLSVLRV